MSYGDRFRRLETAFHRLADLEGDRRQLELDRIRQEDPQLAEELARLLDHDRAAGTVPEPGLQPERIGPYRLLRRLGRGGMGEVWEAEQEHPVRRRVALKLVRSGLASDEVLRRFEAERAVLARLSHPAIPRIHDAGVAPDGRPYVVMELVDGEPLTTFCHRRQLALAARLRLFADVCRAIHHAHMKGIIHRDLKPSNILVVTSGTEAWPKVIDFGIARAAGEDGEADDGHRLTRLGDLLGTLEYMSPEQAAGGASSADTRSDVYALGAILYELLTGEIPVAVEQLGREGLEAALRSIREVDPPAPSVRVTASTERATAATMPAERSSLRRALSGDLDWITMQALAKEPERRYPSASELADDVERHLRLEPVAAGPPSAVYRLGKLARRHRLTVAACTLLLAAIIAGIVGTAIGLVRAREAERRALREAATADRVVAYLVDLFRASDPAEARGLEVTARELLDDGVRRARTVLDDQPAVQARMLRTLGQVHAALGDYDTAVALLDEVRGLEPRLDPPPTAATRAETLIALARAHRGRDEHDRAAAALVAAEALLPPATGPGARIRSQLLREQADLAITTGDHARARDLLEQARAQAGTADRAEAGRVSAELGYLAYQEGDFAAARNHLATALDDLETGLGPDHPEVGTTLNDLAVVEKRLGNYRAALALHERGLVLDERVLGPDHPDLGNRLQNLCRLLVVLDRAEDATAACERALAIHERALGSDHRLVMAALNGLGGARSAAGDVAGARTAWSEALARMSASPGTFYGYLPLRVARNLATLERRAGRLEEARKICRRALAAAPPSDHPRQRAEVKIELAAALTVAGEGDEAVTLGREALDVLAADDALDPWAVPLHRARLAAIAGDDDAAREALRRALAAGADRALLARDPDLDHLL